MACNWLSQTTDNYALLSSVYLAGWPMQLPRNSRPPLVDPESLHDSPPGTNSVMSLSSPVSKETS